MLVPHRLASLAVLASLIGCGGDDDGSRLLDGDVGGEVFVVEEIHFPETRTETEVGETNEGVDADATSRCSSDPGAFGCPCSDNAECNSDFCVPTSGGGRICTQYCTTECPLDWSCDLVQQPGSDPTFICLEVGIDLCRPCTADAQCQAGAILDTGDRCVRGKDERDGSFCGIGCAGHGFCPRGYSCETVVALEGGDSTEQCVPVGGSCPCSGRAVEQDAFTTCNDRTCVGTRSCSAFGLSACDARPWAEETCDGSDNDCDDETDEGYLDTDADGEADCVDADDDADLVPDENDNCSLTSNSDQINSDADPFGDACDADDDDDTILDPDDNCPVVANLDQADSDGDGSGDACDALPPPPPLLTGTDPASPSDDDMPTISGASEAGSIVTFYADAACEGDPIGATESTPDGTFSGAVKVPTDATTVLHGTATDGAGNRSACSPEPLVYTHDATAPAAPVLVASTPRSPSRASLTPLVSGSGPDEQPAVLVRLYVGTCGGAAIGSGSVVAGAFAITGSAAANAQTVFVADAVDAVGNVSACSEPLVYVHDDVAPDAPALLATRPASPSNSDLAPMLDGTAEPGATIRLFTGAGCASPLGTMATVAADGTFAIAGIADANATTSFHAKAVDEAGNVSVCSAGLAYVHDDIGPARPVLLTTTPASPAPSTQPQVHGSADAGTTVRLFSDLCITAIGEPTNAAADKSFTFTIDVPPNTRTTLRANARDVAGNVSGCSDPLDYVADSQPPAAPVLSGTSPASPARSLTPALEGSAELGVTVRLHAAAACAGPAIATFGPTTVAAFSRAVSAAENNVTIFTATATDAAGNVSACSAALSYTHDGEAPPIPVLTGTSPPSPNASSTTPGIEGTIAEAGTTIEIFGDASCGGPVIATLAQAPLAFSVTAMATADSTTTFSARASDPLGNTSSCSNSISYVHDATGPAPPSITASNPSSPAASLTPTLSGSAEPGSAIAIYTTASCTGPVSGSGNASGAGVFSGITVTAVPEATTTFYAKAADALGNGSACSDGFAYLHDSGAPARPVISGTDPASPSYDQTPDILGTTGEASLTVYIYTTSNCSGAPIASGGSVGPTGAFTINAQAALGTTTTFYASAVDGAGYTSPCSLGRAYQHLQPVGAPRIVRFEPPSADNTTTDITAIGEAANDSDEVFLYLSSDCSGVPVNAVPAGVTGTEFRIDFTATPLACTVLTAQSVGVGGNLSPCSEPATFAHYGCAQCVCGASDWIRQGGTFFSDIGTATAYFAGDLYIVGTTEGAILEQSSAGGADAFIAEYGTSGIQTTSNLRMQIGTSARDTATSVVLDDDTPRHVYIAGSTEGDIDNTGVPSNADAWIAKINTQTNARVWTRRYASSSRRDTAVDLAYDGNRVLMLIESTDVATGLVRSPRVVAVALGNGAFTDLWNADDDGFDQSASGLAISGTTVYVHGRTQLPITGALTQTGTAGGGLYVAKIAATGAWVQHWGSAGNDTAADLIVSGGVVYAAGAISGALEGQDASSGYVAGKDIGVVKLDGNGAQVWARSFGTQVDDAPTSIGLNGSTVQILGQTRGVIGNSGSLSSTFGGIDFFLAPLATLDGALGTPRQFGTSGDDLPGRGLLYDGRWYIPGGSSADWTGLSRDACTYKADGDFFLASFCASL